MAPAGQYVFAEMLGISEHFTAGSHEWLPYSDFSTFPKQLDKHQFVSLLRETGKRMGAARGDTAIANWVLRRVALRGEDGIYV